MPDANEIPSVTMANTKKEMLEAYGAVKGTLQAREKELIHKALVESAGKVSRAARKLNISRQLLHYKIKKYHLQRDE